MKWLFPSTEGAPAAAPPARRVLWNRGYRDAEAVRRFLQPSLSDLHDPFLLAGMNEAVKRLRTAIDRREKILLYGDYDVDGTSAVVILKKAVELAGGVADFHVPHRLRDGYGMKTEVIAAAAAEGVSLVISVDTGIRAADVVREGSRLGIDVIITDHHLPEEELPPALAVLNPNRRDCAYPEKNLCGAGVAFKLVEALFQGLEWPAEKRRRMLDSFLKLVAIATVADVVPLTGENRIIVKRGLHSLKSVRNPGLRALLDVAGFENGSSPSSRQVAFQIAPRINAAGRMADARDVIDLFLTEDEDRARGLAAQLHELNRERQETEAAIVAAILHECTEKPVTDEQAALVFAGEGWHRGVVGIVASRVVERFHRPAFVIGIEDGVAQGSGRSIPQFHLLEALEAMPGLFTKFGGHRQAAGASLVAARVGEFRERFNAFARERLTPEDFVPTLEIDAEMRIKETTDRAVKEILELAPFGFGNPAPAFAIRGAEICAEPDVRNEKHVFLKLKQDGRMMRVKAWNFAPRISELAGGSTVDVAVAFEEDPVSAERGYAPWQAVVKDVRPAEACLPKAQATS